MRKCVFLDRDGVINFDKVDYVYSIQEFKIIPGVLDALQLLKSKGFLLIVITNQSGISKGIYTHKEVTMCHDYFNMVSGNLIDDYYYSPYHEYFTQSLSRKPDSLLFEKAIAKYKIDAAKSWMVGDHVRDLIPAKKLGIHTIGIGTYENFKEYADFVCNDLKESALKIAQSDAL
jgi:D-glycero-D-manno-heptose 1,7-bisphosphate phosphatase